MLRIYDKVIEQIRNTAKKAREIAEHDPNLAKQLMRAATSVGLNLAEGSGTRGGHRTQRYLSAAGSARETLACLEIGEALGYTTLDDETADSWDHVIAVLVKLTKEH